MTPLFLVLLFFENKQNYVRFDACDLKAKSPCKIKHMAPDSIRKKYRENYVDDNLTQLMLARIYV